MRCAQHPQRAISGLELLPALTVLFNLNGPTAIGPTAQLPAHSPDHSPDHFQLTHLLTFATQTAMLQTVLARPTPLIRCWLLAACCLMLSVPAVQAAGAAPQAPSELAGAIVDGTVSLTWTVPTDSDDAVEGYNVYINNQYATTVTTNSYTGSVEPDTVSYTHLTLPTKA